MNRIAMRVAPIGVGIGLLMLGTGCSSGTASRTQLQSGQTAQPVQGRLTDDQTVNSDPCAARLQSIEGLLLEYYALHHRLPAALQEIAPLADADEPFNNVCPETGQPYTYNPAGLGSANQPKKIIVYDSAPHSNGTRWCILMPPITSERPGSLSMEVVAFPPAVFKQFSP